MSYSSVQNPNGTNSFSNVSGVKKAGISINLISEADEMKSVYLAYPAQGRFYFENGSSGEAQVVFIDTRDGECAACCVPPAHFLDKEGNPYYEDILSGYDQRLLVIFSGNERMALFSEEIDERGSVFHNYRVPSECTVRIGRSGDNDIVVNRPLVSRYHALLSLRGGKWTIRDTGSTNGIYVNSRKTEETDLQYGDIVFLMGFKVIPGKGFLSINDGSGRAYVKSARMERVVSTDEMPDVLPEKYHNREKEIFNRFPRHREALSAEKIEIEGPPFSISSENLPLILKIGSSVVKGTTSLLEGNFVSLGSMIFPFLTQGLNDKQKKDYEDRRKKRYTEYIDLKKKEIEGEKKREEVILRKNYPPVSEVLLYTKHKKKLWSIKTTDDDFLSLRVGSGKMPMKAEVSYPKQRFQLEEDELEKLMYETAGAPVVLEDIPVMLDLKKDFVCGIIGERPLTLKFAKTLMLRLSVLYSYDEVKFIILAGPNKLEKMEFIRFLPHVWDDRKTIRFIASNDSEAYTIGEYLRAQLGEDLKKPRSLEKILQVRPYYIVFALDKRVFDSMEILKEVMRQKENTGVSILSFYDEVPKESSVLINIKPPENGSISYLTELEASDIAFRPDEYKADYARKCMRIIANTGLGILKDSFALPKSVSFLEMYGAGRVEFLNIAKRWDENNPVNSLAVPVGIGTDGKPFMLDLHQKFQGPHGLVAGMTGSGKSEFLITYILSMAVNFQPDDAAFVIIDYKGGGLAGAFDDPARGIHLPHLVGTITNLDGTSIRRSLISIQSELTRRQKKFNEARSISGESTMDIYTYQRLYHSGILNDPIPHLFIISDEFAELKAQQPEFMDQLVSAARIGRSLGIHLILATQKPSGVVNDQIRSNTKFQVCFKVQERGDSMDMIKRPDAAEIKETGRFYIQVGYNEYFAMGQSAWSGDNYEPQDELYVSQDDSVEVIDLTGQEIFSAKPEEQRKKSEGSQLSAVVKHISDVAKSRNIAPRQLWKKPLSRMLNIENIERKGIEAGGPVCARIGMVDDPENQSQFPFELNIEEKGSLLVAGEHLSGKTTALQTMLLKLAEDYSPEDVNFYVLDYSGGVLKHFGVLPHCGAALSDEDEQAVGALFRLLGELIQERRKLFGKLGLSSFDAVRKVQRIPLILVVIDNFAEFEASEAVKKYADDFEAYMKKGVPYGFRFIVTASRTNEVPYRVRAEFPYRFCLHMKDWFDYTDILRSRCTYEPPEIPGRGLANIGGRLLETQIAAFEPETDEKTRISGLKKRLAEIKDKSAGKAAVRLPVINENEEYCDFIKSFKTGRFPLGYSLKSMRKIAVPLRQFSAVSIYFGNPAGTVRVIENILWEAGRENAEVRCVMRQRGSCFDPSEKYHVRAELLSRTGTRTFASDNIRDFTDEVMSELKARNEVLKEYCSENGEDIGAERLSDGALRYVQGHTKPLFILYENYAEMSTFAEGNPELTRKLGAIQLVAGRYNAYLFGCFYANQQKALSESGLYKMFNPEKFGLLFGGRLDAQRLVSLPAEYARSAKPGTYNRCLVSFQNGFHAVLMPCGRLQKPEDDEDSAAVFRPDD